MKDSMATFLLSTSVLCVIIIVLCYYFYYFFLQSRECSAMESIYGALNGKIHSLDSNMTQYTLKDFYIKSAYNCCSGGDYKNDYVDTCILKSLLKQGVRGLDFEIFSIDNQPVVATSTNNSYYVKETFNYIPFSEVMEIIRNYAFSTGTSPNSNDPILIHLRIKSTNSYMYKQFAKLLEKNDDILLPKDYDSEYHGHNFGDVTMDKLMGKVILIVDRSNTSFMECPEFYKFINITSNSVFMRALHYYDVKFTPDMDELIEFNKQNMTFTMPDRGANPPNPSAIVLREMGCQLLGMRYPLVDNEVEENDAFFNENGTAFVLKPENLRYIPVTIALPPPQNPDLSYATKTVESDFYKFEI